MFQFQLRDLFVATIGVCALVWVVLWSFHQAEPKLGLIPLIITGMYFAIPLGSLVLIFTRRGEYGRPALLCWAVSSVALFMMFVIVSSYYRSFHLI